MVDSSVDSSGPASQGCCPDCGYTLVEGIGERCPECGWWVDSELLAALGEARRLEPPGQRRALLASCLMVAAATVWATVVLVGLTPYESWRVFDGLVVGSVLAAVAGDLWLAAILARRVDRSGPAARALRSRIRFVALTALVLAWCGAFGACVVPPTGRTPVGQTVGLEFVVRVVFFSLPGLILWVLVFVSFRDDRLVRRVADARRPETSTLPDRPPFIVQVFGCYAQEQVAHVWHDTPRASTPELDALIARTWRERLDHARRSGVHLYDGALARLIRCRVVGDRLELDIGPTCYRDFVGTNLYHAAQVVAMGEDHLSNPAGVSATVLTRDGFVLLGLRSEQVAYHAGMLHPFGGALEAADLEDSEHRNIFHAVARELTEELALEPGEIDRLVCRGLVRDRDLLQPEFLFEASLTPTRNELLARFDPGARHQEHASIESCYDLPEAILLFLRRFPNVAPICEAALMLHGRAAWGEEWYEAATLVRYGALPPELNPKT